MKDIDLPDLPQKPLALWEIVPPCAQGGWPSTKAAAFAAGRVGLRVGFHLFVVRPEISGLITGLYESSAEYTANPLFSPP